MTGWDKKKLGHLRPKEKLTLTHNELALQIGDSTDISEQRQHECKMKKKRNPMSNYLIIDAGNVNKLIDN